VPLITYEEACTKAGMTHDECVALYKHDVARAEQASLFCNVGFSADIHARNDCVNYCREGTKDIQMCALELREAANVEHADLVTQAHVMGAFAVAALVFAGFYFGQKRTRKI
jgi:hypothetical protein